MERDAPEAHMVEVDGQAFIDYRYHVEVLEETRLDAVLRDRRRIAVAIQNGERMLAPRGRRTWTEPANGRGSLVRFRRVMDVVWGGL